ncbi:YtzI protein [Lysinibacillus pakistanensis]|uniref:YtzI protein n=1 Tax=Lysinibacillus pakistanensis TaxID=759811 RepID=A0AAX3WSF7_9BACI|nr:YtzI protein [Lysinibacillus pakistanensis]MDM5230004.1 YtzI protein [Lysinibacillus pakistanensis]QGG52816.1 YtzI protein [Lysinibacillus pakistanensis]WHY45602.1 YtzI protein [Lysinibacillus pakistanensis]WHY50610.1 YtzI protein [Lysinibacillus pakistanensis]
MSLITLLVVAVIIVIIITAATIISVNRAYAFKHTIDEKPQQSFRQNDDKFN